MKPKPPRHRLKAGFRMNKRVQTVLLVAFVVAAGCGYWVYKAMANRVAETQPRTAPVVVAATDLKLGSVISQSDLSISEMAGPLPEGAITDPKLVIGRGVVSEMYRGEPVLESRLAAPGAGGGLAATIPPGMRACAIHVDEVVGVAGFVTPGMRVDVLISGNPPSGDTTQGPRVKTLLQNIEVLSAGTDIQKDGEGKPQTAPVVNLLVTPQQAEQLSLASNQAHIQLVLRNPLDTQVAATTGTAVSNLYGAATPAPRAQPVAAPHHVVQAQAQPYVVQVFNGSKQSEQKFESHQENQ